MTDAKAQFDAEVTEHVMTVLHDDGVYRHIKFARPDTGIWRFDLVTWPGHLAISGDLQSYTFRRLHDMFEFFGGGRNINPSYWSEKVVAGAERTMDYSPERARQLVVEHFMDARHQRDEPNLPLWQAIRDEVLSRLDEDEHEAHRAIRDFAYYLPVPLGTRSEDFKPEAIIRRALRPINFEFTDTWEWDLRDFDHHFLLICHAIQWGIAKYRAEVTARAA